MTTATLETATLNTCPRCEVKGRSVKPTTFEAQVISARLDRITHRDGWRLCMSADCDVVYFLREDTVSSGETHAVPFHKSAEPERLVCFCFGHSVAEVEADTRQSGASTIQASIKQACKAGEDDCVRKNPQGRCCLGNVGQVVKRASGGAVEDAEPCCGPKPETPDPTPSVTPTTPSARSGLLASGGALAAAVLSSACCWLPLVALGLGASSAGVGAIFEAWRVPLLVVTPGLLGAGFYFVYRKPRCAPGETCEVPNRGLQRFNRGMLWFTTALVALFAFFPGYIGALTGGGGEVAVAEAAQTAVRYRVEGMTCVGCEVHAREAIEALPGVVSVAVSYERSAADVVWSGSPDHAAVLAAVGEFGYRTTPTL